MPRYFFETDDGDAFVEDENGVDLPDREAARRYAQTALEDMAHDKLPDGDSRCFAVHVRDETGAALYTARLTLSSEWHRSRG